MHYVHVDALFRTHYSCWIGQRDKGLPSVFLILLFVSHLCMALGLGMRICMRVLREKILSPRYVRFGVVEVILQAEVKLIWVLLACCCFTFKCLISDLYFDQFKYRLHVASCYFFKSLVFPFNFPCVFICFKVSCFRS